MSRSCQRRCCCCWTGAVGTPLSFSSVLGLHLHLLWSTTIFLQTTPCACSITRRLHRTLSSSSCRMFLPAERLQTSSTAPTWWSWLTSLFGRYLTFHLETRSVHQPENGQLLLFAYLVTDRETFHLNLLLTNRMSCKALSKCPLCLVLLWS